MADQLLIPGKITAAIYQESLTLFLGQLKKGTDILCAIKEVKDKQALDEAVVWVNKAKTLTSLLQKKVDEICRPLTDAKTEINEVQRQLKAYAEEISTHIKDATRVLEGKVFRYYQLQKDESDRMRKIHEDMVREAEGKLKIAQQARQDEIAQAETTGNPFEPPPEVAPMVIMAPVVVEPPKIKGMLSIWKYEVVDMMLLPMEYLTPDTAKINAAVKSGTREIPGVKIWEEQQIRKS